MVFEMNILLNPGNLLLVAMTPSKRPIVMLDQKLLEMIPFVPRYTLARDGATLSVIPGEFLEALLNDQVVLEESVLLSQQIPWASARLSVETLRSVLVAAHSGGLIVKPYSTPEDFSAAVRESLDSLPKDLRPSVSLGELERSVTVDFASDDFKAWSDLKWLEELSIQDMVVLNEPRTKGWGLLSFSAHPCLEAEDRFSVDSAFCSIAGQWRGRIAQEQFGGSIPLVRPGVLRSAGLELLRRSLEFSEFLNLHNKSEVRETEFITLMVMSSLQQSVSKVAFQGKIKEIVARSKHSSNVWRLLANTESVVTLNALYSQICAAFGVAEAFSMSGLESLNGLLAAPRLDFLDLAPGSMMADSEKVRHVVDMKTLHNSVAGKVKGGFESQGKADEAGAPLPAGLKSQRLEKLHLTARFQVAAQEITRELDRPGSSKLSVREAVFKQAIPLLNRHMLGLETAVGCELYERLLSFRCKPGSSGDTEEVMGYFFGQQLMRGDDGFVPIELRGFSLAGSGVVDKLLKGKLDEIQYENDILAKITLCRSNMLEKKTEPKDRFLDYIQVDRIINEISPLFESLGLGSMGHPDSFAAVFNECKVSLLAVRGLDELDIEDLLRGERMGVQKYVLDALKAGNSTMKALFQEKDPLADVELFRFLPRDSTHFKNDLAVSRIAIQKRKSDQVMFSSAYARRAGGSSGSDFGKFQGEIRALRSDLDKLKAAKGLQNGSSPAVTGSEPDWKSKSKNKSLKRKADGDGADKAESAKKTAHSAEGIPVVSISDDLEKVSVTDLATGKVREYKAETLRQILTKVYKIPALKAKALCLGFGLDPRKSVSQRMLSCTCGDAKDREAHSFPTGFTFTVRDEYQNFR